LPSANGYQSTKVYRRADRIVLGDFPDVTISVSDILP
jgi:hypothetical protein